jgi:hypothetical protein
MDFSEYRFDSGAIAKYMVTPNGSLRFYGRIARADHPLHYRNVDGSKRVEIITESDLFNADSLETFETLPVTSEHPPIGRLDATTATRYMRGMTSPQIVKEVTKLGTFLGQMVTVVDKDLIDDIVEGRKTGLSPGYGVSVRPMRQDGVIEQFNRIGNHTAVVANPRGGEHVSVQLQGLRTDAADDVSRFWMQEIDPDEYRIDVGDWLIPVLKGEQDMPRIIGQSAIDLDRVNFDAKHSKSKPMPMSDMDDGDDESSSCDDCGDDCDCKDCAKKRKSKRSRKTGKTRTYRKDNNMDDVLLTVGNAQIEVPAATAALLQPELDKAARFDSLQAQLEEAQERADDSDLSELELREEVSNLRALNGELLDDLDEAVDLLDAVADGDGDDEDEGLYFDSADELAEFITEASAHYEQLRSDAALVGVDLESKENYGSRQDAMYAALTDDESIKQGLLAIARPDVRTDSYDESQLTVAYDMAFGALRQQAMQRTDSNQSPNYVQTLSALGSIGVNRSQQPDTTLDDLVFGTGSAKRDEMPPISGAYTGKR